jgi:hypothetical protein
VRLEIASDADSPLQKSANALTIENAKTIRLKEFEIVWEPPVAQAFRRALMVENVHDLILDTVIAQPVPNGLNETAVVLKAVDGLLERNFVT